MRDATPTPSALMDIRELARMCAISPATAWRLRAAGVLPPAILLSSQCVRFRRSDVEAWLAAGCAPCNEQHPAAYSVTDKAN